MEGDIDLVRRGVQHGLGGDVAVTRIAEVVRFCRANTDLDGALAAVLDAAIELTGADMGHLQLREPSGALVIAAHRGLNQEFLTAFARVQDTSSASGLALYAGEQIVVDDVETSDVFIGHETQGVVLRAGARAVQSTPLLGSAGQVVGMISTHFRHPHRPTDAELAAVALLAGVAADHLEHASAKRSARWSAETLETLLDILPIPAWISHDPECRDIRGNAAGVAMYGITHEANVSQTAAELGEAMVIPHYRNGERLRAEELPMQRAAATGRPQREATLDILLPNGERGAISGGAAPLFDDDGAVRGVVAAFADITQLRRAEEAREALSRELLHRSANLLAVVQAIARRSFAEAAGLTDAYAKLEQRLQALARATRLLAAADDRGVNLGELVPTALEPFAARFELDGEDAWLSATHVQHVSLALHELGTNALKYGALATKDGVIRIAWRVDESAETPVVIFEWREQGGPPIKTPVREGQGTRLLHSLFKEVRLDYAPDGLRCEIRIPR
jgi:two-component sensor histidine kinase